MLAYVGRNQNLKDVETTEGRGIGLCWVHSNPKGPEEMREADLGSWGPGVYASANLLLLNSNAPLVDHP